MAIDRQVDPPQKILAGTERFFGGAVTVTAHLWPVRQRRHRLFDSGGDEGETDLPPESAGAPAPASAAAPAAPPVRKKLFISLLNSGPAVIHLRVIDVQSALGHYAAQPEMVLLAPQQRAALEAFSSPSEPKIAALDVTVTLRWDTWTETRTLRLAPPPPPPEPAGEGVSR
jgi:hypothetical protein